MVEQSTENAWVAGSSPACGTTLFLLLALASGAFGQDAPERRLQIGERLLLTVARRPALDGVVVVGQTGRVRLANGAAVAAAGGTLADLRSTLQLRYGTLSLRRAPAPPVALPLQMRLNLPAGATAGDARRALGGKADRVRVLRSDDREEDVALDAPLLPGDAVVVSADEGASVTIVGAVRHPAASPAKTLGDAIVAAGGLRRGAQEGGITVRREGKTLGPYRYPQDAAVALRPGDLVAVALAPKVDRVSVVGAVRAPGLIEIDATPTLAEAVGDAGGILPGYPDLIIVVRSVIDPKRGRFTFAASDLAKPEVSEFVLHPNDLIEIGLRPKRGRPGG